MATTTIAALGSTIAVSSGGEKRKAALGNGTNKAGAIVSISASTGKIVASDIGVSELFEGIVDLRYDTAIDTAIADGAPLSVIVPTSGHVYRVRLTDPGAAGGAIGLPVGFSAGAGELAILAALNTAGAVAYLAKAVVDDDTVAEVIWK